MHIEVVLDTGGAAVAGVDQQALVDNIQAEVDKLTTKANVGPVKPTRKKPPPGAQGDWSSFQWVVDVATDPGMAKVYAQALLYALNSLLQALESQSSAEKSKPKTASKGGKAAKKKQPEESHDKKPVRVSVQGKEFLLPLTTAAIKALLKQLGDQ
jgi:hypothetical protein